MTTNADDAAHQLATHRAALLDEAAQAPDEWALVRLAEAARFRSAEFGGTTDPLPGMVSVFRVTHALAARVLARQAVPADKHRRFGPGRWLLLEYLRALHGFNAAVATAHAAGGLLVRDASTGLPVARLDAPSRAWAEQWERVAVFGSQRDDRAAAALLLEPAADTYPEGLAVRLADAVAWVEAEGIAAPGELAGLLDAWQAKRESAARVCSRWRMRAVSGDALGPLVAKLYAAPGKDEAPKPEPGSLDAPEPQAARTSKRQALPEWAEERIAEAERRAVEVRRVFDVLAEVERTGRIINAMAVVSEHARPPELDRPGSSDEPVAAPATVTHRLAAGRADILQSVIERATADAGTREWAAVFARLRELALEGVPPFTGAPPGPKGVLYYTDPANRVRTFSPGALRKRLNPAARGKKPAA